jgi:hypothetical protein
MTTSDQTPKVGHEDLVRQELERPSPGKVFVRRFIEGNYFYVLSAISMMAGCYLLMPSGELTDAEQFARRLKSLLALQSYEFLVITAAAVIVWKLGRLSDAFTLLVIELVLLFDPTFFTNAFYTLRTNGAAFTNPEAALTNFLCLGLVPLKIIVLVRALHLELKPRTYAGLAVAAGLVYLGEAPLNLEGFPLTESAYYYLLGWGALLTIVAFPSLEKILARTNKEMLEPGQWTWLPRFLFSIPVAIVAAHYLESASVYEITFYPVYLGPLLVAGAYGILKLASPKMDVLKRIVAIDAFLLIALLCSLPAANIGSVVELPDRNLIPNWIRTPNALGTVGVASMVLYCFFAQRYRYRPAFYRAVFLMIAAFAWVLYESGWIARGWSATQIGLEALVETIRLNPRITTIIFAPFYIGLAYCFRFFWIWLLASIPVIALIGSLLPGKIYHWIPEMAQLFLLTAIVLRHRFADPKHERTALAILLAAVGVGRFVFDPSIWAGAVVGAEFLGFLVAGFVLGEKGYLLASMLQAAAIVGFAYYNYKNRIDPGFGMVAGALALFAIGLVVTFWKETILGWFKGDSETSVDGV